MKCEACECEMEATTGQMNPRLCPECMDEIDRDMAELELSERWQEEAASC